jgi:hypothetical protein
VVDYVEFLAATVHLARLERDERLWRAFKHFDVDNTGEERACVGAGEGDLMKHAPLQLYSTWLVPGTGEYEP